MLSGGGKMNYIIISSLLLAVELRNFFLDMVSIFGRAERFDFKDG